MEMILADVSVRYIDSCYYKETTDEQRLSSLESGDLLKILLSQNLWENDMLFDFANFQDILNESGLNENILIDVIGQVVSLGEMNTLDVANKATKELEYELRDSSDDQLTSTLWKRFAETMWNACETVGNVKVICLIRLAKCNTFKGERSISNVFEMSLLEIKEFVATYVN
ncbi:predicted protein [Arabidopsis lyrata subsp. lyrata]|uniref:Predicted protein n=1 Tax=Arabidopsis lyrata subsp. lyrata TaxID=81972 RepID=D7M8G7_ARALL|nr:predicted protein [Arabidopsis lyrata subsp. lyrata]